ncbi:uncharacterized protein EAF01_000219 [Botrytis porri]|uniref:UBC core domain-containing protein n=1 Tax=Botrytis porri TaxID=87229 RepID=A0A4Z1KLN3_9HELO|nr:uncharacterized protein EAF01_000219 [Botrytis porri]KAF7913813.1 hypothetical protein EAF01_000219 [Botrytis porri]TGO86963.1 hypothetical protein BPOR_0263g00080 [Botrytis porri]
MAEDPNIFEPWVDFKEEPGLNEQSKSTSTYNSSPDTKITPPCGEKLSKIRERHKNLTYRAIRSHFKQTPLSVLMVSREKDPYNRTRNLCLQYDAVHSDDTTPYLSVCPASLYSSRVSGFGSVVDLTNAIACIEGPSESPYAGGIFFLHIFFPVSYPQRPMKVRFLTQIHHPNISADEDLRIPSITTEWLPEYSLKDVLLMIFSLLSAPELDDDSIPEIAKEYIDNYSAFFERAKLSTIKHASREQLDVRKLVIDWIQDYMTFDYTVASCNKALLLWRQNIWETLPKDGNREDISLQCVIPDSAIVTISQNLRRLCSSEIGLGELDLGEWDKRDQYLRDNSLSSLGNTLVAVWLKLQDEKRGIENDNYNLPGGASNDTVEACQRVLKQWRNLVWDMYPENTFSDRESVIPNSAMLTISNNLEKIGSGHIKLEHLDLWEWDYSTHFLAEDNKFFLRELLRKLWERDVEARQETTDTAVPEGGHGSKNEGPKSLRRVQLGLEAESSASSQNPLITRAGIRSGSTRRSRSKQELQVTKSEPSTQVKEPRFKQGFETTNIPPGAIANSSKSVQGAGIAKYGLGSETRSSDSNKGPQIPKGDLNPDMQYLKSVLEKLNLPNSPEDVITVVEKIHYPFSSHDISYFAEKLKFQIPEGKLSSIVEEANKRVKKSNEGKSSVTK